jgi:hypothetical protein
LAFLVSLREILRNREKKKRFKQIIILYLQ